MYFKNVNDHLAMYLQLDSKYLFDTILNKAQPRSEGIR